MSPPGNVSLYPSGMNAWSFKPGELVSKTRIEYRVGFQEGESAFSGHFSQMQASPCYQNSETMTCTTCHDPHHSIDKSDRHDVHREQCLSCHDQECRLPLETRMEQNQDACVACHMPKAATAIPHTAVTNHQLLFTVVPKKRGLRPRLAKSPPWMNFPCQWL